MNKPKSRQYQAQQRNLAQGLCAYGQKHGPPVKGLDCCQSCQDKKRACARDAKGCKPYGVTGLGRPPKGTPKSIANASKIKKLEQQREKRLAMIKRAEAKFDAKKAHHSEWLADINAELAKLGAKIPGSDKQYSSSESFLSKVKRAIGFNPELLQEKA